MIRKLLLATVICLFVTTENFARDYPNEIWVKYGGFTSSDIIESFSDAFGSALSGGSYTTENKSTIGAVSIGYNRSVSNNFALGVSFTYQGIDGDLMHNNQNVGTSDNKYYSVLLGGDLKYIQTSNFSLYSGLYGGLTFQSQESTINGNKSSDNDTRFGFQINALGVRFGSQLGGIVELGFGERGLLSGGISLKF